MGGEPGGETVGCENARTRTPPPQGRGDEPRDRRKPEGRLRGSDPYLYLSKESPFPTIGWELRVYRSTVWREGPGG